MNKAKMFLFTAGIVLATAFTFFACSSDGPDDGGGGGNGNGINLSDLPEELKQVWLVNTWSEGRNKEYTSNGNLVVLVNKYRSVGPCSPSDDGSPCLTECIDYDGVVSFCEPHLNDTLKVGEIQNGQISFLPTSVDNKYLDREEFGNNEYCTFSGTPKTFFVESFSLYAIISGKSNCRIRPYLIKSGKASRATLFYVSEPGSLAGTQVCTYSDGEIEQTNYDLNFSRGWNLVHIDGDYWTSDISKGGTLEWWLQCEDD